MQTYLFIPLYVFLGLTNAFAHTPEDTVSNSVKSEAVIILHGLARSERSMGSLSKYLEGEGYIVRNVGYRSTSASIENLSRQSLLPVIRELQALSPDKIHFVGHSMGGILSRYFLAHHSLPNIGRVVTLGTPHQGSELVDKLGSIKPFQWINGPAGNQLGTHADSFVNTLPVPDYEIGCIAGTRSYNPVYSALIEGDDDGKVSVARAQLPSQKDFIALPLSHTFMMNSPILQQQVNHFLRTGTFQHNGNN